MKTKKRTPASESSSITAILLEFPELCYEGFGRTRSMSDDDFCKSRGKLADSRSQLEDCEKWIAANCSKRKTINRGPSSYGFKHQIERDVGIYISNGVCIAAFLMAGYSFVSFGLNCWFNASLSAK